MHTFNSFSIWLNKEAVYKDSNYQRYKYTIEYRIPLCRQILRLLNEIIKSSPFNFWGRLIPFYIYY